MELILGSYSLAIISHSTHWPTPATKLLE